MKIPVGPVLAILFMLFALVQLNDPDAAPWVLLYGVASVIWWNPSAKALRPVAGVLAAGTVLWMWPLLSGFSLDIHNEASREAVGLGLVLLAALARMFRT